MCFLDVCINSPHAVMSLAVFNFPVRNKICYVFRCCMKDASEKKDHVIWPSNVVCSQRMAGSEDLPLLFREYDKACIAFKGPAVSHIVWKERRSVSYFQNTLVQFLFNELQKLHPRMNHEHNSVLELFSLGQYPTIKLWGMHLGRILSLGATVHPWTV